MRTCYAALASLLLLTITSFAQRADYDVKKIQPAVILSPSISFNFGPQHPQGQAEQWLEVEVNFESRVAWTDELTVKY